MTHVHRVAIIGAGFAGLGMVIALARAGERDVVVLEQADDVGGTWRDNTYPGSGCDVPSVLYSYSFAPNPDWSRAYPRQREIQEYLRRCAREHDVLGQVRLGVAVLRAEFDDDARLWRVHCSDGSTVLARALVGAVGSLHQPSTPDLPGLDRFAGHAFHSARWDHDVDLSGTTVAVVGTGASAVQFVPEVAKVAARVQVFQRSAPWVLPKPDRRLTAAERALFRLVPPVQRLRRAIGYWLLEARALGMVAQPRLMRVAEAVARRHLRAAVADPDLVRRLTPDYPMGCKRILVSGDYYPALARPHVDVVTEPISEVREHGVVTADGVEHPADVIVFGTGFHVVDSWQGQPITGSAGRTLREAWREGPRAHHGITVAGFPNLFLLFGPNTGLGHNSIVFMIEAQIHYVLRCLRWLGEDGVLDVRPEVADRSDRLLQRRFEGTVWAGDCTSYYLDDSGRNRNIWPGSTVGYWWRTRRPRRGDFTLSP